MRLLNSCAFWGISLALLFMWFIADATGAGFYAYLTR